MLKAWLSGRWTARITCGQVSVNGEVVTDSEHILRPASKLDYFREPWKEPPAPCKLTILYEDAHLVRQELDWCTTRFCGEQQACKGLIYVQLVLDKPSGLQVLPGGAFHQRCALTLLHRYRQANSTSGLAAPAHRLGRGTSGDLLLYSRGYNFSTI